MKRIVVLWFMLAAASPCGIRADEGTGVYIVQPPAIMQGGTTSYIPNDLYGGYRGDVLMGGRQGNRTSNTVGTARWRRENWNRGYPYAPSRTYYRQDSAYSLYEPAYRYGFDTYLQNEGQRFSDLDEDQLQAGWERARGASTLTWREAESAAHDAYNRAYRDRAARR